MFPWLSQIAPCFEKYLVNSLSFEYVPVCATASPGHVRMYIDYDVMDEAPANARDFAMMYGTVTTPIWQSARMKYAPPKREPFFTAIPDATEDRLSDVGTLYFYTEGNPGTYAGELWVNYDITLMKPQASGQEQVTVGGDEPLTKPLDQCPGPDGDEWTVGAAGMSIVRDLCNLETQVGMPYDIANQVLTNPAASGKTKRRVILNVEGGGAINNGGLSWTDTDQLVQVVAATNCSVTAVPQLNMLTDTLATPWKLQRAFDIQNTYDALPGSVQLRFLDALGKVPGMIGNLKSVVTLINGVSSNM